MKVRLELDVHPSEALRVASLISALHNFVTVLSSYSAPTEASPPMHRFTSHENSTPADEVPSPSPIAPCSTTPQALPETPPESDCDSGSGSERDRDHDREPPPPSPTNASVSSPIPPSPTNASVSSPPPDSEYPRSPTPSEPPRPPPPPVPSSYFPSPYPTLLGQSLHSLVPDSFAPPSALSEYSNSPTHTYALSPHLQPSTSSSDDQKTSISLQLQNLIAATLAATTAPPPAPSQHSPLQPPSSSQHATSGPPSPPQHAALRPPSSPQTTARSPPLPPQHSDLRPPSPPRSTAPVCKREKHRHKHASRPRKSRNASRSRKIDTLDRPADAAGNRIPRPRTSGISGKRHKSEESDSSSSSQPTHSTSRPEHDPVEKHKTNRTSLPSTKPRRSSSNTSSRSNGRQNPPFTPITSPRVIFEAVARGGISVKHAVSNLQGMLSRTSSPLSEKTLVSAAVAEMASAAGLSQHPYRGVNIVRVFVGLGDGYLAAFRNRFVIKATRQFAKKREVGCDVSEFLGYSDGLSALIHENCILPDAAMKTVSRLLLKEGHWSAAITTLCKMAEMSNGELAHGCRDKILLRKIQARLVELARRKEFSYDITYLNNTLKWRIPVPEHNL